MEILTSLFFIIAILYSLVGFGGGSSYIAILMLFNVSYSSVPIIALSCNLIVVSGSIIHFLKNDHIRWNLILPFVFFSIPAAYLGGLTRVDQATFKLILGICLLIAGLRMFFNQRADYNECKIPPVWATSVLGALLGYVSGLVGIGGGIFLSPIMYNLKWGRPKQISALCSLFIFFNSIAGLLGQIQKINFDAKLLTFWPLVIAVFIGGQLGSFFGTSKFKPRAIEILTSILVLFVSMRILFFS